MGNLLSPVSGTIVVVDATEDQEDALGRSGPRFPRPRLQRLKTSRLAEGTLPPVPVPPTGEIDFEEAITEVNTPAPKPTERPTTVS